MSTSGFRPTKALASLPDGRVTISGCSVHAPGLGPPELLPELLGEDYLPAGREVVWELLQLARSQGCEIPAIEPSDTRLGMGPGATSAGAAEVKAAYLFLKAAPTGSVTRIPINVTGPPGDDSLRLWLPLLATAFRTEIELEWPDGGRQVFEPAR